ncbi:MAG: DUF4097 family beta strand repeat-containing protein [Anaerolineales bacterium]
MNNHRNIPNLFWPVIFIGVGSLLFLSNLGMVEPLDFNILWRLWPVFLVVIGVDMLFGRRTRWLAALLTAALGLAVVAFLYFSPVIMDQLPAPEMVTESFIEPLEDADSADITLDFDRGNLTVDVLDASHNLFEADVTHNEESTFRTSGSGSRSIRLELDEIGVPQFSDLFNQDAQVTADVGVASDIPLSLKVNIGSGNAKLYLQDLTLEKLEVDGGSGRIEVSLPTGDYPVKLGSGSGGITISSAEGASLDMKAEVGSGKIMLTLAEDTAGEVELDSGSGDVTVVIPEGAAVRLDGSTGSGSVRLPDEFERFSGGEEFSGAQGVWQTPGFEEAVQQILIKFDIGSGSLRVEYP